MEDYPHVQQSIKDCPVLVVETYELYNSRTNREAIWMNLENILVESNSQRAILSSTNKIGAPKQILT